MIIYEPKGKAREYSPLAMNLYRGCGHKCNYCYVPSITRNSSHDIPEPRKEIKKNIIKDIKKYSSLFIDEKCPQILMSFTGDPYNPHEPELRLTQYALEMMDEFDLPVALLSKGGDRALVDIDIFKSIKRFKYGASLTFFNETDSIKWEAGAMLPMNRIETLKKMYDEGIKTWVSLEPVIDPDQTLKLIKLTMPFVHHYKIGKLNHNKDIESSIDWGKFAYKSIDMFRKNDKLFYIKKDLLSFINQEDVTENEKNKDFLCV